MHDLDTIKRMNREASLAAITESVTEADEVAEREAAMRRHPAGSGRITEPAIDPAASARCPHCGDVIPTRDDNLAEHIGEYHTVDLDGLRAALKDYDDSLIENTDDGTVWEIRDGSMLAEWARKTLGLEA